MNTNRMELNLNELEAVNGGWDWDSFFCAGGAGAICGALAGGTLGICLGPVGWCALAGAAVVGGVPGTVCRAKN